MKLSDFDDLMNYALNLDDQSKLIIIGTVGLLLLLFIIRRGRRKKIPEPVKPSPFETELDFSLDGLQQFNLEVSEPSELAQVVIEAEPEIDYSKKYKDLKTRYMSLEIEFSSLKGRVDHWKQRCLRAEEINEGYGSDVSAIYKSKGDIKVSALEYLLAIVADTNSIDQGIRTINKPPYPRSLQIGSTVVGLAIVAFFWLNKEAWGNLMLFINTPRNQIFVAIALVALAIITYYYRRKR